MELQQTLQEIFPGEASASDRLRRVFARAIGKDRIPTRQKISDILAGRRDLPQAVAEVLEDMVAEESVKAALRDVWDRFGASVLWSLPRDFVLDPNHLEEVAEELRHGNLEAFRTSARLMGMRRTSGRKQTETQHAAA